MSPLLDYREPPRTPRSDRIAALEAENAALRAERKRSRSELLALASPGGPLRAAIDRILPEEAQWDETNPMTRLAEEAAEASEELRLLRELEAAYWSTVESPVRSSARASANSRLVGASADLAAFRARQKEAARG